MTLLVQLHSSGRFWRADGKAVHTDIELTTSFANPATMCTALEVMTQPCLCLFCWAGVVACLLSLKVLFTILLSCAATGDVL